MELKPKNKLGQYFTPTHIANLMVKMMSSPRDSPVLEPSSGSGVFLDALHAAGFSNVTGVEIDDELASHAHFNVENSSFVSWIPPQQFSTVIGNPPYIRWKNLEETQREEISKSRHWGTLFNSLSDYLNVFIVNSIDVLEENGELIFITPSFWMHTQHAEGVRNYISKNGYISHLVSFGEAQVFEGVSSSIIIFRFVKGKLPKQNIDHYQYIGPRKVPVTVELNDQHSFRKEDIPQFQLGQHWTIATSQNQSELKRLQSWCNRNSTSLFGSDPEAFETLGDYCTIANGMVSGLDKAFKVNENLYSQLTDIEKSAIMKVAKGADLSSLVTFKSSRYIDLPQGLTEEEIRSTYPNLISHLEHFKEQLLKRYSYGRDLPFWEWAFRRSETFLCNSQSKIFVPCKERITNKSVVRFSLVPEGSVATQDVTAFAPKPEFDIAVEYVCAYLSLDEVTQWIRMRGLIKGGVAEFSERPLASIPFRTIDKTDESELALYSQIIELVKSCTSSEEVENTRKEIRKRFISLGLPEWLN